MVNRLKNDKAEAMREMDVNRRAEFVELAQLRKEAVARAAKLDALGSDPAGGTYAPRSLRPWLGAPPPPPTSQWG